MTHKIKCKCGAIEGHIEDKGPSSRLKCYCKDCQAFAHYLDQVDSTLDPMGGTEIVQLAQPRLHFSKGQEHLAIMRMSPKGTLRWYASCCKTPIANTAPNPAIGLVGLVHNILDTSGLSEDFGQNIAKVHTKSAKSEQPLQQQGLPGVVMTFIRILISARLSGGYRKSPLFDNNGDPVVTPEVITLEERNQLQQKL